MVTARTSRLSLSIMRSTSRTSVASKRMGPAGMRRQYRPSDRPSDARTGRRLTFQGAAQVTVRMPPVPVVHWLPQVTLARQAHDGVLPQAPGNAGQAYDGGLPAGPPIVTWQYVVATAQNAQLAMTQTPAWSSWMRAFARSQSLE